MRRLHLHVICLTALLAGCGSSTSQLVKPPSTTASASATSRQLRGRALYIVHGFLNTTDDTCDLTNTMRRGGLYTQVINVSYPCSQSIATSGHALAEYICNTCDEQYGVDIIGHSMGGLVARWAVEECGLSAYVHNLVTLGTPHQGATAAYLANALLGNPEQWQPTNWVESAAFSSLSVAGYADALTGLLPGSSTIRQLNQPSHTNCDYFTIAGQVHPLPGMPINIPTDLVVATGNANWQGLGAECQRLTQYVTPSNHTGLLHDDKALRLVKTILWKERSGPVG